ncbi:hypothetical protein [Virgibacillus sp. Bac330]|uniref:hypothetical protein n=1 Tax=Virgibacillus sp. Bac330 TaxID=2419841 RepID=UPI000EF48E6E|nr:hypothetical protein [Virgibacillus sp. Bac330]
MKFFLTLFRAILIGTNLVLINFQPNTDTEIKLFFATRLVFFLMLIIDYANVAYYNKGLEKIIGLIGLVISLIFACVDGAGFFNFILLEASEAGYVIKGNSNNLLTSMIGTFSLSSYVFYSWVSIVCLLGIETVNYGARYVPNLVNEAKNQKVA